MKIFLLLSTLMITLWADAHIFVYHRFGDSRHPSTNTTKKELIKEFEYFKNNDYKVVRLEKLVNAIKNEKKIPDNWIVLTIDDSFKSFYINGLEIFRKYNYPFSLFVYVEASLRKYPDYLSFKQLKEISKYGSLEFHSYGHPHLTQLSDEKIKEDFSKGLKVFEKKLQIKPKYYSYPYGEYTNRIKKIAKSFNFDAIINQNLGAIGKNSDIFDLDRSALVGKTNLKYLLKFKHLNAIWISPTSFPKDGVLRSVHIKTNEKEKRALLYVSKNGWKKIKVKDGEVNIKLNTKLTKGRNRVIVSIGDKITTKLLIKDNQWN
ncbi:MAG: polysaccharide deacetylase family protein [Campylobacteraceae bacterium]|nr:polysaccharide deacetylase family protein [Campylobacteraceae bacterium]